MSTLVKTSKDKVVQEGIDSAYAFIGLMSVIGLLIGIVIYPFVDIGLGELISLGAGAGAEIGIIGVLAVVVFVLIKKRNNA